MSTMHAVIPIICHSECYALHIMRNSIIVKFSFAESNRMSLHRGFISRRTEIRFTVFGTAVNYLILLLKVRLPDCSQIYLLDYILLSLDVLLMTSTRRSTRSSILIPAFDNRQESDDEIDMLSAGNNGEAHSSWFRDHTAK